MPKAEAGDKIKLKLYTRTGDMGETGLYGGQRVSKTDWRIEICGNLDELNAALGFAISLLPRSENRLLFEQLTTVQNQLFQFGSEVASLSDSGQLPGKAKIVPVNELMITNIEMMIDTLDKDLPQIIRFILPGGDASASALHLSRAICRRCERFVIETTFAKDINPNLQKYLNRLSDYLFAAARYANHLTQTPEITWDSSKANT